MPPQVFPRSGDSEGANVRFVLIMLWCSYYVKQRMSRFGFTAKSGLLLFTFTSDRSNRGLVRRTLIIRILKVRQRLDHFVLIALICPRPTAKMLRGNKVCGKLSIAGCHISG